MRNVGLFLEFVLLVLLQVFSGNIEDNLKKIFEIWVTNSYSIPLGSHFFEVPLLGICFLLVVRFFFGSSVPTEATSVPCFCCWCCIGILFWNFGLRCCGLSGFLKTYRFLDFLGVLLILD